MNFSFIPEKNEGIAVASSNHSDPRSTLGPLPSESPADNPQEALISKRRDHVASYCKEHIDKISLRKNKSAGGSMFFTGEYSQ